MAILNPHRRTGYDVTNSIDVQDPSSVCKEVQRLLFNHYPDTNFQIIERAFADCEALYKGNYPNYLACDTPYHNLQHVMDVSLAVMRLIDGYEKTHDKSTQLGAERISLGLVTALFHDSGYIRHKQDKVHQNGAEYTKVHVSRSAKFLKTYLDERNLGNWSAISSKLVHYTGYEIPIDKLGFEDPAYILLGHIVGTADLIAQMSDRIYLEKCRDFLFIEFELGGLTTRKLKDGTEQVVYASPKDLLQSTPAFVNTVINERLRKVFKGAYGYAANHFNGPNLYMEAIRQNCDYLEQLVESDTIHLLRREPTLLSGHSNP